MMKGFGLMVVLVWGLASCGDAMDQGPVKGTGLRVVNGAPSADDAWPGVVLLYSRESGSICTGTFITPEKLLTAAHCTAHGGGIDRNGRVESGSLLIIEVDTEEMVITDVLGESLAMHRHPSADDDWDFTPEIPEATVNRYDIAVLTFPRGYSDHVVPLATRSPRSGDVLTIVGYGLDQNHSRGDSSSCCTKREGINEVESVGEGLIRFRGADRTTTADGTEVSAAPGDSGGPLFIDGRQVGVTSGGRRSLFGRTSESMFVDLTSSSSRSFLRSAR